MPDFPAGRLNQAILDSLSEGVFTVDTDWRITSFNCSAENITGVPRNEALGQLCSDVLHSTLCERHCPIRQALADHKPVVDRRCHVVDIDGESIPLSVSAAVLTGENGAMLGGVLLGLFNAFAAGFISSSWQEAITFALLIGILLVRPTGLLGERVAEKV